MTVPIRINPSNIVENYPPYRMTVPADRGYFGGAEILTCEQLGMPPRSQIAHFWKSRTGPVRQTGLCLSLEEAATQFNRYNRKKIVIVDNAAARIDIGGAFDAENIETFARLLNTGFGLTVRMDGDEIRVSSPAPIQ